MRTQTLTLPNMAAGMFIIAAAVSVFAFTVFFAIAQENPTIETVVRDSGGDVVTSAAIGTEVHAEVNIASTTGPVATSTVDFHLFPNTTCSASSTVEEDVPLEDGFAQSGTTTVPATGLSYLVHYDGEEGLYEPSDGECTPVSAVIPDTTITTELSTTTALVGTSVFDSATLQNETANASGTVAYTVYSNSACSADAESAGVKTVTDGVVPDSDSLVFNSVGTFYWQAVYSGDEENNTATSTCENEELTILATSTPPEPEPEPGENSISGTVYNDLDKDGMQDGDEPGLSGWEVQLYAKEQVKNNDNGKWWKGLKWGFWGNKEALETTTTDADGHYSFDDLAAGTYLVRVLKMDGWKPTEKPDAPVVLEEGESITDVDFGHAERSIKDDDDDGDGGDGDDGEDGDDGDDGDDGGNGDKNHGRPDRPERGPRPDRSGRGNSDFSGSLGSEIVKNVFGILHEAGIPGFND